MSSTVQRNAAPCRRSGIAGLRGAGHPGRLAIAGLLALLLACQLPAGARSEAVRDRIIAELTREAATLLRTQPTASRDRQERVAAIFAANDALRAEWRNRGLPPFADLAGERLPLALLARGALDATGYAHRSSFLDAIAASEDPRRMRLLFAFRDRDAAPAAAGAPGRPIVEPWNSRQRWNWLLREAASLEWAEAELPRVIAAEPQLSTDNLGLLLLDRFGPALGPANRRLGFETIRRQWPRGVLHDTGSPGKQYWHALLQLDPVRASNEIADYLADPPYDLLDTLFLLQDHNARSDRLATALRRAQAGFDGRDEDLYGKYVHLALLGADPQAELPVAMDFVERVVRRLPLEEYSSSGLGNGKLVFERAFGIDPDFVANRSTYLLERPMLDKAIGLRLLDRLVARQDAGLAGHIRRWLANDRWGERRKAIEPHAANWNAYGQAALQAALQ